MYWPEVDFKFSEIAKFGPLLAQKRQNWGKFFYLQTPKKGVFWPFLALLLGTPSQALKILTVLGCLEKVYQVSRPGKANQPLFWAFSVKRMILYCLKISIPGDVRAQVLQEPVGASHADQGRKSGPPPIQDWSWGQDLSSGTPHLVLHSLGSTALHNHSRI